jgi:hypothetical protein
VGCPVLWQTKRILCLSEKNLFYNYNQMWSELKTHRVNRYDKPDEVIVAELEKELSYLSINVANSLSILLRHIYYTRV